MIQIFLDGMEAAIPEKTSIKFTEENPYFTKTSSYTYEIELPLDIEANRQIFGYVNRLDVVKDSPAMSARLVVDNRTLLVGTAHATSVTNTAVKVQLLGSEASYNYGNKMDETYIDELEMGDWLTSTFPEAYPYGYTVKGSTQQLFEVIKRGQIINGNPNVGGTVTPVSGATLPRGEQPWVAYPVRNSSADVICNRYVCQEQTPGAKDYKMEAREYYGTPNRRNPEESDFVISFAVQPYVWYIAEKIAKATGFTLSRGNNYLYTNTLYRRIFILNANNFVECRKCLPHWSVNEFWTEVENTFGVVMTIDYETMSLRLTSRNDYYHNLRKDAMTVVDMVLDEYTTDFDDETQVDISTNNVGFADHDGGNEDILSEFVLNNADINDSAANVEGLIAKMDGIGDRKALYKKTLFKCKDGRQYIYARDCASDSGDRTEDSGTVDIPGSEGGRVEVSRPAGKGEGLAEVNMFRPRMGNPDKEDIDISLRFVPARFITADVDVFSAYKRPATAHAEDDPVASFPVVMLERPDVGDMSWAKSRYKDEIDLEAIITEEADEPSDSDSACDVIYIAIDNSELDTVDAEFKVEGEDVKKTFSHPRALLRERTLGLINGGKTVTDPGVSLSLIPIAGQRNLASESCSQNIKVDTLKRYCIKFIANAMPDVGAVFNIRNRLFVCEKIEADITVAGLGRMLTGYFYEISL
ncbi:MAG: hypothetical protein NC212_10990 [Staphylococcus sp.]|nr:hypothetical protein [Staphylococcus sp.]